jgi:hypothetical protein
MTVQEIISKRFAAAQTVLAEGQRLWAESQAAALPVLEKLAALGSEPYVYEDNFIYAQLTGDVGVLTDAIRALRTGGFKGDSKPERKSATFTTHFRSPSSPLPIFLSFSSSVCRRVKVGTKTETVDVFEIQCGESEEFKQE